MSDRGDNAKQTAALFKALSSETRVRILRLLRDHSVCVGALAARLDLTQSAVSQHLQVLRNAGLVTDDERGYFVHYSVSADALRACSKAIESLTPRSGPRQKER